VRLENVVATTGLYSAGRGFFVQEQTSSDSGRFNGVYVNYTSGYETASGTPAIEIGQVMIIEGTLTEYLDLTEVQLTDTFGSITLPGSDAVVNVFGHRRPSDHPPTMAWTGRPTGRPGPGSRLSREQQPLPDGNRHRHRRPERFNRSPGSLWTRRHLLHSQPGRHGGRDDLDSSPA